jgi:hypothetical protein
LKVAGKRLWFNGVPVDGRLPIPQTFKRHMEEIAEQLGGELTPAQEMLARRACMIATLADIDDAAIAREEEVDQELYLKRSNALLGVLKQLGLARIPRDITPRSRAKVRTIDAHTRALLGEEN